MEHKLPRSDIYRIVRILQDALEKAEFIPDDVWTSDDGSVDMFVCDSSKLSCVRVMVSFDDDGLVRIPVFVRDSIEDVYGETKYNRVQGGTFDEALEQLSPFLDKLLGEIRRKAKMRSGGDW